MLISAWATEVEGGWQIDGEFDDGRIENLIPVCTKITDIEGVAVAYPEMPPWKVITKKQCSVSCSTP